MPPITRRYNASRHITHGTFSAPLLLTHTSWTSCCLWLPFALSGLPVMGSGSSIGAASTFPGLDWEYGGPAAVVPLSQPADGTFSSLHCSGSSGENRTCRIYNACFDKSLKESDGTPMLVVYSGESRTMTMQLLGEDGVTRILPMPLDKWPPKGPLAFSGVLLMTAPMKILPETRPGSIPEEQVAAWIDAPQTVLARHYLRNFAHVVCDDWYPLWWLLTRWMGWRRGRANGTDTQPPTAAASSPAPAALGVLLWDNRAEPVASSPDAAMSVRLYQEWFPGVPLRHVWEVARTARVSEAQPLVCFRSLTLGVGARSMMRGAAYAFHFARTFDDAPLRPWYREYVTSQVDFVDFLLDAYGLPGQAAAQAAVEASGGVGTIVVLNRRDGKRELRNVDALIAALRLSVGGRAVREVRLDALPLREQASVMQGADVVLGIHSAGSINLM